MLLLLRVYSSAMLCGVDGRTSLSRRQMLSQHVKSVHACQTKLSSCARWWPAHCTGVASLIDRPPLCPAAPSLWPLRILSLLLCPLFVMGVRRSTLPPTLPRTVHPRHAERQPAPAARRAGAAAQGECPSQLNTVN